MSFKDLKPLITARFQAMLTYPLFSVEVDKEAIWNAYISAFPEEDRQEHNCNSCRHFIRTVGAAVNINPTTYELSTVWDVTGVPERYKASIEALAAHVRGLSINGLFHHHQEHGGVDKSFDFVRNVSWEHFHVMVPRNMVNKDNVLAATSAKFFETATMLERALNEITVEALETTAELITQGSVYMGNQNKERTDKFLKLKKEFDAIDPGQKENFCFRNAHTSHPSVSRIRNDSFGTLIVDLSKGTEINDALKTYERITAPENYQRPEAIATPKMIENAKARLTELGLISALDRRQLDARDLNIENCFYVYRPKTVVQDVFGELAAQSTVDPKTLEKVEEITMGKFITDILPVAETVKILFEHRHLGNLITLTGQVHSDSPGLFKWDNGFAWSYTGGVADAIKEKVKAAGGKVDGWMRISLAWGNFDDLDLHFGTLRNKSTVYYGNKHSTTYSARLDVDMNAGGGHTREPVENIDISKKLPAGAYVVNVHQFHRRETSNTGYQVQVEHNGITQTLSSPKSPSDKAFHEVLKFNVTSDGTVAFENSNLANTSSGMVKWGIKTGTWQLVKTLTISPNHWKNQVGQRHWIFLLDGCKVDETVRPFYNVMLRDDLREERKVFEMLANKINVAPAEGAELSGLGFSETGNFYVQVSGKFQRILKVTY